MENKSFNQRLTPDERLKIIQTIGWNTVTKEVVNSEGWISNLKDDHIGLQVSVNINSGTVTNHGEGYSMDIVDWVTFYIPQSNEDPPTRDSAIKWIGEILGRLSNRVHLEPSQMKFKHAVKAKKVKYGMVPRNLLKDQAISPTTYS